MLENAPHQTWSATYFLSIGAFKNRWGGGWVGAWQVLESFHGTNKIPDLVKLHINTEWQWYHFSVYIGHEWFSCTLVDTCKYVDGNLFILRRALRPFCICCIFLAFHIWLESNVMEEKPSVIYISFCCHYSQGKYCCRVSFFPSKYSYYLLLFLYVRNK